MLNTDKSCKGKYYSDKLSWVMWATDNRQGVAKLYGGLIEDHFNIMGSDLDVLKHDRLNK